MHPWRTARLHVPAAPRLRSATGDGGPWHGVGALSRVPAGACLQAGCWGDPGAGDALLRVQASRARLHLQTRARGVLAADSTVLLELVSVLRCCSGLRNMIQVQRPHALMLAGYRCECSRYLVYHLCLVVV